MEVTWCPFDPVPGSLHDVWPLNVTVWPIDLQSWGFEVAILSLKKNGKVKPEFFHVLWFLVCMLQKPQVPPQKIIIIKPLGFHLPSKQLSFLKSAGFFFSKLVEIFGEVIGYGCEVLAWSLAWLRCEYGQCWNHESCLAAKWEFTCVGLCAWKQETSSLLNFMTGPLESKNPCLSICF